MSNITDVPFVVGSGIRGNQGQGQLAAPINCEGKTVAMWVNMDNAEPYNIFWGNSSDGEGFWIHGNGGDLVIGRVGVTGSFVRALSDGKHFILVDLLLDEVHIDGALQGDSLPNLSNYNSNGFGMATPTSNRYLEKDVDQAWVFDGSISAKEKEILYNNGLGV